MKKFIIIFSIFFLSTLSAHAAGLSIELPDSIVEGQQFSVTLKLNTGGISINSVDIGLVYPRNILTFKGYKEDGTVVRLWVKQPKDNLGTINFSGIIPGGVEGSYNPNNKALGPLTLVKLLFVAKESGSDTISIGHSTILINDGKGTELAHERINASINISKIEKQEGSIVPTDNKNEDKDAPLAFDISFVEAGLFSRTPPLIIFNASDLGSGIEKYQINEGDNNWSTVTSPLVVYKGIWEKNVTIRAYDYNGNFKDSTITIPPISMLPIVIITLMLSLIFARYLFSWYKKRR